MIDSSIIYPILNAFGYARNLAACKADDDAARQGYNIFIATLSQISQTYALLQQVQTLEKVAGQLYVSRKVRILIYLSAPLVSSAKVCIDKFVEHGEEVSPLFKKSVVWLHNHIGSICQIASVVTNIALFRLGYQAYAITSLSILALGYLERRNALPLKVREVFLRLSPWIGNIGLLITHGDRLSQGVALIDLYGRVMHLLFSRSMIPYDKVPHSSRLSFEQFNKIIDEKIKLNIDREHIFITPFPIVRSLNFTPIKELFDSMDWSNADIFSQLDEKLAVDARWMDSEEYKQTLTAIDSDEITALKIAYAKSNLHSLISDIENESIETGEPLHYGVIKNYLGYIAENLPKADQDQQVQILLQLAVEGGNYCGPGVYYQLETAATALLLGSSLQGVDEQERPRLPLKQRILLLLQQERLKIVSAFHLLITKVNPALNLLAGGEQDIHAMNRTIHLLATDFGLPDQGAQHDMTAGITQGEKYYYRYLLGMHPKHLWSGGIFANEVCEGYTKERVLDAIDDQTGLPLIPRADIFSWALEWIENTSASEKEKEEFIEQLQDGQTFESNLQFHDDFIQAMLVDMGILRLEE